MPWMAPRLRFGSALAVATVSVAIVMAVLLGFELTQRDKLRAQTGVRVDSITAPAFLLDREFLRFKTTVDAFLNAKPPPSPNEVRLRLDILISKLLTVQESPGSTLLFSNPDNVAVIEGVQRIVTRADLALNAGAIDQQALKDLAIDMDGFTAETQALGNAADLMASRVLEDQNRELLAQNLQVTGLTLFQLVLLLATSAGLFWRYRLQQQERDELEALNERLSQAQQAADRANQGKSKFLANMSHELRTPLNGVVGLLDVLSTTNLSEEQTDLISTVRDSADHLLTLLNDILDMSALESGKIRLRHEAVDIIAVLNDVAALMRPLAQQKGIAFTLSHDMTDAQWGRTDATRLRQILFNLMSNAIKFTERGGVRLRAQRELSATGEPELLISVTDSGIGMDKATVRQLFQRFYQVDAGLSRRFSGAGLGLGISMSLTRMMQGDITVTSQLGHGSTFCIRLPWVAATPTTIKSMQERAQQEMSSQGSPLNILVAEDHIVNQKFMAIVLQRMGHDATFCENGELAVKALQDKAYDVVLMDIHMPVMDGLSATRAIRAMDNGRAETPIIALTADVLEVARTQAMQAGVNIFLTKPVQLPELRQSLAAVSAAAAANAASISATPSCA